MFGIVGGLLTAGLSILAGLLVYWLTKEVVLAVAASTFVGSVGGYICGAYHMYSDITPRI